MASSGRKFKPSGRRATDPFRAAAAAGKSDAPQTGLRSKRAQIAEDTLRRLDRTEPWVTAAKTYLPADIGRVHLPALPQDAADTVVTVVLQTTLEASAAFARAGHSPCTLNFASARRPGGGFKKGANAQEENLCRSSGLYLTIKDSPMYQMCRKVAGNNQGLYFDTVIYSPGVPVLKDDQGALLVGERAFTSSFLTCPAVNAKVARTHGVSEARINQEMESRISALLSVAAAHGEQHIVLGAFGCGVFGGNIRIVSQTFARLIRGDFARRFSCVTFAVVEDSHLTAFRAAFE